MPQTLKDCLLQGEIKGKRFYDKKIRQCIYEVRDDSKIDFEKTKKSIETNDMDYLRQACITVIYLHKGRIIDIPLVTHLDDTEK